MTDTTTGLTDAELARMSWRGYSIEELEDLQTQHLETIEHGFMSRGEARETKDAIRAITTELAARASRVQGLANGSRP